MRQFLTVALKDDLHVSNISSSEVDSLYLKTNKQYRRLLQSSSFTSPDTSKEHWQLCSLNGPSVSLKKITANVRTRKAVVIFTSVRKTQTMQPFSSVLNILATHHPRWG